MAEEKTLANLEARLARLEGGLSQILAKFPGTIVDPGPDPGGGTIADPAPWPPRQWGDPAPFPWPPRPWGDPAPFPWGQIPFQHQFQRAFRRPGIETVADEAPIDVARFTLSQLQTSLHSIAAERIRLDGLEEVINKQIEEVQARG